MTPDVRKEGPMNIDTSRCGGGIHMAWSSGDATGCGCLRARAEMAGKMAEALKEGIKVAKMTLSDCGPCDHDVNICVCGLVSDMGMMEEVLSAWDVLQSQKETR